MKINDFEGLCLTNAHLAFRPKGFSRRFAPQNDIDYAFTLLHMCILPHLRITTLPLMTITTIPYYHVRNRDADEQRLASDKDWKGPRTDGFLSLSLFISSPSNVAGQSLTDAIDSQGVSISTVRS